MFRALIVTLVIVTARTSAANAQTTDTTTDGHRSTSLLFEATIGGRLNQQPYPGVQNVRWHVSWELGPLFNRGDWAFGAAVTAMATYEDEGASWGVRSRYRRWLKPSVALDLGAGILIGGETLHAEQHYPGFTGLIGFSNGKWLGVNLELHAISTSQEYYPPSRIDIVPSDRGKSIDWAWLLSAKLSGAGALALTVVEVFALMVACASFDANW